MNIEMKIENSCFKYFFYCISGQIDAVLQQKLLNGNVLQYIISNQKCMCKQQISQPV